jgi:hypothetical protein
VWKPIQNVQIVQSLRSVQVVTNSVRAMTKVSINTFAIDPVIEEFKVGA